MKKQIKKQERKLENTNTLAKTKVLKWVIIGFGIAIICAWMAWFACDCYFISKGITIEWEEGFIFTTIKRWYWDPQWYNVMNKLATVTLSLLGGYIVLLMAYMVICGLNVKDNIKYYIYQLIATAASFITITLCIIKAGEMMINEKCVIDLTLLPPSFDLYHLDYLKWLSIAFACTIFTNVLMLCSFRKYDNHTLIKDCNILMIVLAGASLILFIPFTMSLGWNDPFIGGAESLAQWAELIQSSITWKHVVCQCVTSPMGTIAGMLMVLLVIRLVVVMFVYNKKWGEKKSHIIIFSCITFLLFASFIIAHSNKLDFVRLVNDYNSMKLACLLVMIAQTLSCILAGTYGIVSCSNYAKRVNK